MCLPRVSAPPPPPAPPEPQPATPAQTQASRSAQERENRQRRAAFGPSATLLTGGQGVTGRGRSLTKRLLGE
ncbi:MAG: hypothetical protein AAFY02_17690 [Pseudomonadota bacterium]